MPAADREVVWDDGTLLLTGSRRSTLLDVNCVVRVDSGQRAHRWAWNLLGAVWLDTADTQRIRTVAVYFAHHGILLTCLSTISPSWPCAAPIPPPLGRGSPPWPRSAATRTTRTDSAGERPRPHRPTRPPRTTDADVAQNSFAHGSMWSPNGQIRRRATNRHG
ncbi:hypothetical protein [Amycolatopsis speibonae]|uniref:Uncharacterized protein n=1 Tax=Amycolatopsis speibonae TaxID=1450224 RepID=A0ABV7PAF9_9PSEU